MSTSIVCGTYRTDSRGCSTYRPQSWSPSTVYPLTSYAAAIERSHKNKRPHPLLGFPVGRCQGRNHMGWCVYFWPRSHRWCCRCPWPVTSCTSACDRGETSTCVHVGGLMARSHEWWKQLRFHSTVFPRSEGIGGGVFWKHRRISGRVSDIASQRTSKSLVAI